MSRTLQTSTIFFSRVSYLFECNAKDTYVLRMTRICVLAICQVPDVVRLAPDLVVEVYYSGLLCHGSPKRLFEEDYHEEGDGSSCK